MTANENKVRDLIATFEKKRVALLENRATRKADLELKYLAQQCHYTTPAGNYHIILKAIERGTSPVEKILKKYDISFSQVAEVLEVQRKDIEALLNEKPRAPLVLIDGEDAQALRTDVLQQGRENAIRAFCEADWRQTLRFYRPGGLELDSCVRDLFEVLTGTADLCPAQTYPLHGVIIPKIEHPDELKWFMDALCEIEKRLELPEHRIKLQFLVESAWAVVNLPGLVQLALPRLAGIILGNADYSADVQLPEIRSDHPMCDWIRYNMINIAGAVGIPAIDNMTINYPVADAALSPNENKARILTRLKECFNDARHGLELGMSGKWVGHPLQLFVTLLAYRMGFSEVEIQNEIQKLTRYEQAVRQSRGTTVIDGVMTDRAMDRHTRAKLRKATAWGKIAPTKALALGIITAEEFSELKETDSHE